MSDLKVSTYIYISLVRSQSSGALMVEVWIGTMALQNLSDMTSCDRHWQW
jgi:hypothetical protein